MPTELGPRPEGEEQELHVDTVGYETENISDPLSQEIDPIATLETAPPTEAFSATYVNTYQQIDGRWISNITTAEGESLQDEFMSHADHDTAVRDEVLSLPPGSSKLREKAGQLPDGTEVMFQTTYTMTESGTLEVESGQREIDATTDQSSQENGFGLNDSSSYENTFIEPKPSVLSEANPQSDPQPADQPKLKVQAQPKQPWWQESQPKPKISAGPLEYLRAKPEPEPQPVSENIFQTFAPESRPSEPTPTPAVETTPKPTPESSLKPVLESAPKPASASEPASKAEPAVKPEPQESKLEMSPRPASIDIQHMAEPAHATTEQPAPQDTPDGPTGIHAEVTSETTSAPASEAASETVSVSESMSESVSESASTTETALTQEFVITNQTAESPTLKTPIVASVETAIVNEASIETAIVDEAPMEVVSTNEATLETPVVETTTGPAVEIASAAPAAELINSIDTTPVHEHQESVTQASETISESIHVATIEAPVVQSAESIVTVSSEEYSTEVPQAATEEAEELFVVAEAPEPAVLETFEPLVMTKAEPKTASVFQEIPPTKFTYETPNNGSVSDLSEKRVISQPVPNNLETGLPRWQPIHYPAATTSADAPDTNDDDQDIVFEFDQPESSTRATHHTRATRSTTV